MQFFLKPAFGLSLVLGLMAVITMAVPVNEASNVYDLISSLDRHENGIEVLCGDGVVRSITPNLTVLAYKKLDAQQIQKVIDTYGRDDKLTKVYAGVNGNDVVDPEQLYHPSKDILPDTFASDLAIKRDALAAEASPQTSPHVDFGPGKCYEKACYGIGNCDPGCTGCFTPFPGFRGNCHN